MNSSQIFNIVEELATKSPTEKNEILKSALKLPLLTKVIYAALNPFITYGIDKVDFEGTGEEDFDDSTWDFLTALSHRKLTGTAAQEALRLQSEYLNKSSFTLLSRILKKDLRAGLGIKTINKAWPGLIPVFEVMLAKPYESERIKKWPQTVSVKLDGVRVITIIRAGEVNFYSRTGKEFTTFDHLKKSVVGLFGEPENRYFVFDGEVVTGNFNKTVSEVRKKGQQATDAKLIIFDGMSGINFELGTSATYTWRLKRLAEIIGKENARAIPDLSEKGAAIQLLIPVKVTSEEGIIAANQKFWDKGFEGSIVKDPDHEYEKKRSYSWMKIKKEESIEMTVVDAEEGTGKYEGNLGALVCKPVLDGLIVNGEVIRFKDRVNVGSGLTDADRGQLWKQFNDGELVGRIIEVEYHEITPDGSLRHPRFVKFRDTFTGSYE